MVEQTGDIWDRWRDGLPIVIPTNLGWRSNGSNVMGAGLAKQAAAHAPLLPVHYGAVCQRYAEGYPQQDRHFVYYFPIERLIMAASKPLNAMAPHLSWQGRASYDTVHGSLVELRDLCSVVKCFALPLLGTGNGGLDATTVLGMTRRVLGDTDAILMVPDSVLDKRGCT